MKQSDIKPCAGCGRGVMHDRVIAFYRLRATYLIADVMAIQRHAGLEQMLGSPALASVMGVDADIAKRVAEYDIFLCTECTMKPLAEIMEKLGDEDEDEPEAKPAQ